MADINILRPKIRVVELDVQSTGPLLMHNWSERAKDAMLEAQIKSKAKKAKKEDRDPQLDYEESMYRTDDGGYALPANAFKNAMIRAAKLVDGLAMTDVTQMVQVLPDEGRLVRIESESGPAMRRDVARINNGKSTDLRFRAEFQDWTAKLRIQYNADVISAEHVANLLFIAGTSVGVGDWRIEKKGVHGGFTLPNIDEVEEAETDAA